jgi:hypothetical protein
MHEQKFISLVIDVPSNVVQPHLRSYLGPTIGAWLLVCLNTPSVHLSSTHFLTTLSIHFSIPHPIVPHVSQCQCGHTIDDLGIYLLRCPCGNECIVAHDTLWNIIAIITSESEAQIQRKVSHLFPCHTQKWMDIVITRDCFWTLAIHPDAVQHVMTTTHASRVVAQDKAWSYIERTPGDDFIPLTIETHGCLHPHFDSFLTSCVQASIVRHQQPPWYLRCLYLIKSNECW